MDFAFSAADERFRRELRAWLAANRPVRAERVPHDDASLAAEVAFLRDWQQRLHAAGYVGLLWPREYGGRGAGPPPHARPNPKPARPPPPPPPHRGGGNQTPPAPLAPRTASPTRPPLPP